MAFPSTGILDNFSGSDETPISTNWSGPIISGQGQNRKITNRMLGQAAAAHGGSYYDVATYGPDCEVYGTYASFLNNGNYISLLARGANMNSASVDGYYLEVMKEAGTDTFKVQVIVAGTFTQLGATENQDVSAGDVIGMRIEGSLISVFLNGNLLTQRTDSQVTAAGSLGVEIFGNTASNWLTDFGGGDYVAPTPDPANIAWVKG
jgi:hypothetical protein